MAAFTTCVTSKSVDFKKNYIGQNVNAFDAVTTQLEVFFVNNANDGSLAAWLTQIVTWQNTGDFLPVLTVHGITFANCRIINVDISSEPEAMNDAIRRGSINITIEERISGDLSNLDANNYSSLGTLLQGNIHNIKDISEDISYNVGINDQFSLNHSVSVTLADGNTGTLSKDYGLQIAKAILDSYLPAAAAGVSTSIHSALVNAGQEGKLSASVNQITGEATYTRSIDLLAKQAAGFATSNEYSHNLELNNQGIITVVEQGKISPTSPLFGGGTYAQAAAFLPTALAAAVGRCAGIFADYTTKLDRSLLSTAVITSTLGATPVETTRNFNAITQEVSYTVSFSNDPNILAGYSIDRSTDINKDSNGVATLAEKTSFIQHGTKCNVADPIALYTTDNASSFARIIAVYNSFNAGGGLDGGVAYSFKLLTREVSYNPNGKNLSYSITYTSDATITETGSTEEAATIRKIVIDISDKIPQRMRQEYPVVSVGMVVHDPGQTSLGSRSVTITANLDRILSPYALSSPAIPISAINYMSTLARSTLLNVFMDLGIAPNDIFMTEITYSFDSKKTVTLNATANYLATR